MQTHPDVASSATPSTTTYVGLDLSLTSTGIAIIRGGHAQVDRVMSKPTKNATTDDQVARMRLIATTILHLIPADQAVRVAVEGPSFASTGSAAHILGGLWWIVRDVLSRVSLEVLIVPPATVKKYATGRGNAGKDEVLAAVVRRYADVDVRGNDEADALVLASIAARLDEHPIDAVPAAHYSTLTTAVSR